jgi:hypothetical protein
MAGIVRADTFRTNTIKSQDSDVTAMTIDGSGSATFLQPILQSSVVAFSAYGGAQQQGDTTEALDFTSTTYNYGNNFSTSTNTWTAPVAGVYYFSFSLMCYSSEHSRCIFSKNDVLFGNQFYASTASNAGAYIRNNGEVIVEMAVNDTMKVMRNASASSTEGAHSDYRHFTGMLLG